MRLNSEGEPVGCLEFVVQMSLIAVLEVGSVVVGGVVGFDPAVEVVALVYSRDGMGDGGVVGLIYG